MAHGYGPGEKYRGGSSDKRSQRTEQRPSKGQDSRKTHDTSKKGSGGKKGK